MDSILIVFLWILQNFSKQIFNRSRMSEYVDNGQNWFKSFFPRLIYEKDPKLCLKKKIHEGLFRSSRSQVFFKIGVLKNFPKFTGKHLLWIFFLIKLQARRPATVLKKRFQYMCFRVNIAKFLRKAFFIENLRWFLLPLRVL